MVPPRCLHSTPRVTGSLVGKPLLWSLTDGDIEARGVMVDGGASALSPGSPKARWSRAGPVTRLLCHRAVEHCLHMSDRMVIYFFIAASYAPW